MLCSIILDSSFPKWDSDKYNCLQDAANLSPLQAQHPRGYGLGSFGPNQPTEQNADEDMDMADDPAVSSQPEPLIPYGGLNKYYLPPSPMKTKHAPSSASKAEASPTLAPFHQAVRSFHDTGNE
jgi:hypothetical protein